jgi:lysophospholipase L1-like esterase
MAPLPSELMHPPLMAIGDSLYNGMRSVTIDAEKTRDSPPAMIARGLGISEFLVPDLPRPVIVDLENWLERLSPIFAVPMAIPGILNDLRDSIRFWATGPANVPSPSGARAFDNIAFAGATSEDMFLLTAEKADTMARDLAARALAGSDLKSLVENVGTLLIMSNARFTLAPDPDTSEANPFRRRTSLEIVEMRQPKRLIVSIGHNDGLIDIVLRADPAGASHLAEMLAAHYPTLVRELCALPDAVEAIYVNLLPAPSAVSSLMPTSTNALSKDLGRYHESYETLMCYRYGTFKGERLHEIDLEVQAVNQWIMDEFRTRDTKGRVHFVDIFRRMKDVDSKNNGRNPTNVFVVDNRTCTNEMFQANPLPGSLGFKAGGLQGLDGIHLTAVGNALLATWVLETIAATEATAISKPVMALDPLIRNPPNAWSWALFAYRDIMRAQSGKPHNRSSLEMMAVQHSVDIAGRVMSQMSPSGGRLAGPIA